MSRNSLTKAENVAPARLNLVNVGLCIFYITILPIIAISEIQQCENGDQFIIHCGKSQRRLHLIEVVLYFLAGCLLAIGWGILSLAIPAQQGGRRGVVGGGVRRRAPPPLLSAPPLSYQSPDNQLVAKMGSFHLEENNNRLYVPQLQARYLHSQVKPN